jgi:hypothetical protein
MRILLVEDDPQLGDGLTVGCASPVRRRLGAAPAMRTWRCAESFDLVVARLACEAGGMEFLNPPPAARTCRL